MEGGRERNRSSRRYSLTLVLEGRVVVKRRRYSPKTAVTRSDGEELTVGKGGLVLIKSPIKKKNTRCHNLRRNGKQRARHGEGRGREE